MRHSGRMDLKKENIHKSVTFISNNVFMPWIGPGALKSWKDMAWGPGTSASPTGIVSDFRWWSGRGVTTENPSAEIEASHRGIYCRPPSSMWWWTRWSATGSPWRRNGRRGTSSMTTATWRSRKEGKFGKWTTANGGRRRSMRG